MFLNTYKFSSILMPLLEVILQTILFRLRIKNQNEYEVWFIKVYVLCLIYFAIDDTAMLWWYLMILLSFKHIFLTYFFPYSVCCHFLTYNVKCNIGSVLCAMFLSINSFKGIMIFRQNKNCSIKLIQPKVHHLKLLSG